MNYIKWKIKRSDRKEGRKRKPTLIRLRQQIKVELPKVVDRTDGSPIRFPRELRIQVASPDVTHYVTLAPHPVPNISQARCRSPTGLLKQRLAQQDL